MTSAVVLSVLCLASSVAALPAESWLPEPPVAFGRAPVAPFDTGTVDYLDYDIAVRLIPARHFLEGSARVVFRSRVSRLGHVDFVLYNDTLRILSVTRGGQPLAYSYNSGAWTLSVQLADTLGPDEEDSLEIGYCGYITAALSSSLNNYCRLDSTIGFSIVPYTWYPAPYDCYYGARRDEKSRFRTTLTVPANWHGIANEARLDSSGTDTSRTYVWQTARSSVAAAFGAGPFRLSRRDFGGMPVSYYDFDTSSARIVFAQASSVLDYLNRAFGVCTLEQMNYVENLQIYGASVRGLVLMPLPYQLSGLVHETSHQWWGTTVTPRYRSEIWLNEGFASYSEVLFQEDSLGRAVRRAELDTMARRYLAVPRGQDRAIIPAPTGSDYYFTIVYNKGAWVLHMLRWVLGDSAFFRVMNAYATGKRDSSVTVGSFRQVAEQVSGQSLDWFFDEWLYDVGAPAYAANWQAESLGPGNYRLTVVVRQTDVLFDMPLPLTVFSSAPRRDTSIRVSRIADTIVLDLLVAPDSVVLDYDDWILDRGIQTVALVESPSAGMSSSKMPAICRGVLELPQGTSHKPQATFSLLDAAGRRVLELNPGPNDVSRLAPGVYFVESERPVLRQRVVVVQ